jgi:hypothetical protein
MNQLNQNGEAKGPSREAISKETVSGKNQSCLSNLFTISFVIIGLCLAIITREVLAFVLCLGVLFLTSITVFLCLKFDRRKTPLHERQQTPRMALLEMAAQKGAEISGFFILSICLSLIIRYWSTLWPLISKYL